jgi:hypothetical protein
MAKKRKYRVGQLVQVRGLGWVKVIQVQPDYIIRDVTGRMWNSGQDLAPPLADEDTELTERRDIVLRCMLRKWQSETEVCAN